MTRPLCCGRGVFQDEDVGNYDAFISIQAAIRAIRSAAASPPQWISGDDWRRRVEILGPVGVAARTSTVEQLWRSSTPSWRPTASYRHPDAPLADGGHLLHSVPARRAGVVSADHGAGARGGARVIGCCWAATPHWPSTRPTHAESLLPAGTSAAGLTSRTCWWFHHAHADLSRPLNRDDVAHRSGRRLPDSITPLGGDRPSCASRAHQAATLNVVAHPRKRCSVDLRRRTPHSLFLVDRVRKDNQPIAT